MFKNSVNNIIAPISVVIPVLNERATLPTLFRGLERQILLPAEIIFVDAGSTDGSTDIISAWFKSNTLNGVRQRIVLMPDALPGAARNAGIEAARKEWIAFLDAGVVPEPAWLSNLFNYAIKHDIKGVFGMSYFLGKGTVGKALCALSYGYGVKSPVLPASLFHRDIFKDCGLFISELRAGEDILWINEFLKKYPQKHVCHDALVVYDDFPKSIPKALKKWYIYGINAVKANVFKKQQIAYFVFAGLLIIILLVSPGTGLLTLLFYLLFRGCIVPIKKSSSWYWWKGDTGSFLMAFVFGILLDIAKISGFFIGHAKKILRFLA